MASTGAAENTMSDAQREQQRSRLLAHTRTRAGSVTAARLLHQLFGEVTTIAPTPPSSRRHARRGSRSQCHIFGLSRLKRESTHLPHVKGAKGLPTGSRLLILLLKAEHLGAQMALIKRNSLCEHLALVIITTFITLKERDIHSVISYVSQCSMSSAFILLGERTKVGISHFSSVFFLFVGDTCTHAWLKCRPLERESRGVALQTT